MPQGVTTVIAGLLFVAWLGVGMVVDGDGAIVLIRGFAVQGTEPACRESQMQHHQQQTDTTPGTAGANS